MTKPKGDEAKPMYGTPELATLIHTARLRKGYSRPELAATAGVSRTWVWEIEEGRKAITGHEMVLKMATALDLNPDKIYAAQGRVPPDIADHAIEALEAMYASARQQLAKGG